MKRALTVLFTMLLILTMFPGSAFADASDTAIFMNQAESSLLTRDAKVPGAKGTVYGGAKSEPARIAATTFHDETLPASGWLAIDSDGDGWNWMYAKDYSDNFFSLDGRDGECLTSASYVNALGALNPDNWLVSPAITVPQGKQLDFLVSGQDPKNFSEHYGVYVSTTSQTDLSTFTEVYSDTVSHGGGVYEGHFIDLRSYAGQTVYIAFRHYNCTDMYWLNLDGLSVTDYTGQAPDAPGSEPTIIRLKGKDRYETSIVIAQKLAGQGTDKFPGAIIATGDSFPDALAGSALSTAADAPILLISNKVPSTVDNAIAFISDYVDPNGKVYILGGTGVVPEAVERRVKDLEYQGDSIIRFAGQDRYETNLKVLALLRQMNDGQLESILVCDGTNWPDAATASATGLPILLVPKAGLNDAQKSLLATLNQPIIDVIGGPGAVSDSLFNSLKTYDPGAVRLAGANRAETAVKVARTYFDLSKVKAVTFAYGANFPDTIAGGLLAHLLKAPILYGDSKVPTPYINADAPYVLDCGAKTAYVLGGEALVGDDFIIDLLAPNML